MFPRLPGKNGACGVAQNQDVFPHSPGTGNLKTKCHQSHLLHEGWREEPATPISWLLLRPAPLTFQSLPLSTGPCPARPGPSLVLDAFRGQARGLGSLRLSDPGPARSQHLSFHTHLTVELSSHGACRRAARSPKPPRALVLPGSVSRAPSMPSG